MSFHSYITLTVLLNAKLQEEVFATTCKYERKLVNLLYVNYL